MADDIFTGDKAGKPIMAQVMSPLADPVVAKIYQNEIVAGLAAQSFIGAVLSECGEIFGNVVSLTPQMRLKQPGNRGFHVDVVARSDTGRIALQEVQLYFDPAIYGRNVLEASYLFVDTARVGTRASVMQAEMPHISAVNILGHTRNCRKSNKELLQPIHFFYDKEPRDVAFRRFAMFDVQLPYLPDARPDFSNPFYCWCALLHEMHFNKKLPEEVCAMEPSMKKFVEGDAGARQFLERYGEAAASPEVRQAYHDWVVADLRERGMMQGAREEGLEEGLEKGLEKGREEGRKEGLKEGLEETARKAIAMKMSTGQIERLTGLTRAEIDDLRR
jgi:hypothetical protein